MNHPRQPRHSRIDDALLFILAALFVFTLFALDQSAKQAASERAQVDASR